MQIGANFLGFLLKSKEFIDTCQLRGKLFRTSEQVVTKKKNQENFLGFFPLDLELDSLPCCTTSEILVLKVLLSFVVVCWVRPIDWMEHTAVYTRVLNLVCAG